MPCYDLFVATDCSSMCACDLSHTTLLCNFAMPAVKKKLSVDGTLQTTPLRGTFTAEEVAFLKNWLPRYMATKRLPGKKLLGFWEPMWENYWASHPLPPLTAEQLSSGVDQGDRQGERAGIIQKVSEIVAYFAEVVTHLYVRKCVIGLVITAAMLRQVQASAPYWI